MRLLDRLFPDEDRPAPEEVPRLLGMMGLFFVVVCAVGILRPVKNALALDGLGETDFYKVYLVSAAVVLFVPLYSRLIDRFAIRILIPVVALVFAAQLVLFRVFYVDGSTVFGLLFYGWYDLFAAALVAQFFMATQSFFNARSARQVYPLVIAGGSIGATMGGGTTALLSERIGTPNLLLVAAGLILVFAAGLPFAWKSRPPTTAHRMEASNVSDLKQLIRDPHVRLIAASVLLTMVVKQIVDYQFNTMTKAAFVDRDAISAFQGRFNAVTQWLPLVTLAVLHPLLSRFGVGVTVLFMPLAMLAANIWVAFGWGLWSVVAAKGVETSLRYSTERAGREILYVPIAEALKLKAKTYIDVGLEKGAGKVLSAILIFLLLRVLTPRQLTFVTLGLSAAWLIAAMQVRREYVRTLARSIAGHFASFRGVFASISEASTRGVMRRVLLSDEPKQVASALALAWQAARSSQRELVPLAGELNQLIDHPNDEIRTRALVVLTRAPSLADTARVRARLTDPVPQVREAAVQLLCANAGPAGEAVLRELLQSGQAAVRTAALACLVDGRAARALHEPLGASYVHERLPAARAGDPDARYEVALALGAVHRTEEMVRLALEFARDPDARVAGAAITSLGRLRAPAALRELIAALGRSATRRAAREALQAYGAAAVPMLTERLLDSTERPEVRRAIPAVMAELPGPETAVALLHSIAAPETDQLLDFRAIKALSRMRASHSAVVFDPILVADAIATEVRAAQHYRQAAAAVNRITNDSEGARLLLRALGESFEERREGAFRVLGLIHPQNDVYHCYNVLATSVDRTARANALEWLEQTVGHEQYRLLSTLFREESPGTRLPEAGAVLSGLWRDNDAWIARLAAWTALEARVPRAAERLADTIDRAAPANAAAIRGVIDHFSRNSKTMEIVEKVFLLQQVDLLHGARTAHLAALATIAAEVDHKAGMVLMKAGERPDALYVVVRGAVELHGAGEQILVAREGAAFGTWALIDDAATMVDARVIEDAHLLCITREAFQDLLSDQPELALGLLQGLARRIRALVA